MANTYQADQVESSPPWLQRPYGARWLAAFGTHKDWIASAAKQAVKASLPTICPPDALGPIGSEMGLPQGIVESTATYRARLQDAFTAWQWAGTPYGLLRALQLAGYPSIVLQTQSGRQYQLGSGGTLADLVITTLSSPSLGGSPQLWSDIAVLITQPWPSWWGGSAPANGSNDQRAAADLVLRWKGAWNRCVKLAVLAGPAWNVGITWNAFTWGTGTQTTWTPPAG